MIEKKVIKIHSLLQTTLFSIEMYNSFCSSESKHRTIRNNAILM